MAKDKKKDKKKKEKKSKRNRRDVESEATGKAADVDVEVDGGNDTLAPIPIKLSTGIASPSNSTAANNGGGWSWGAAFSAASQVQPNEDDLDDNFLKATAASDGGSNKGITGISQLANDHAVHKHVSNGTDNVHESQETKTKRKRSESASSIQSDDDGSDKDSEEDVPLEGRMVDVDGDMSLVLVDKISGNIYSSGAIQDDGKRLVIGKLVNGEVQLDSSAVEQMKQSDEGDEPSFPYETNADDHCETPLQSYKDILPLLNEMRKSFGGKKESMKIYDPYFCDGSVIKHLSSLGYSNVHNKKDDCYAVWESKSEPEFDVFLTNPPYSEDHIEKLMKFVTSSDFGSKPWLLLMPQWVHKKDYYINATTKNGKRACNPFYIVPKKRYVYLPPANFREKKDSDTHKKSSPFVSMWFCWGGSEKRNGELMNAFHNSAVASECDLARSKSALRDLRRSGSSKSKKSKKTRTSK